MEQIKQKTGGRFENRIQEAVWAEMLPHLDRTTLTGGLTKKGNSLEVLFVRFFFIYVGLF